MADNLEINNQIFVVSNIKRRINTCIEYLNDVTITKKQSLSLEVKVMDLLNAIKQHTQETNEKV